MKKKALYKKWMSMLLAGVVTTTGFMGGTVTLRAAETTNWVGDEGLTGTATLQKRITLYQMQTSSGIRKKNWRHFATLDRIHSMRLNGENTMEIRSQVRFLH